MMILSCTENEYLLQYDPSINNIFPIEFGSDDTNSEYEYNCIIIYYISAAAAVVCECVLVYECVCVSVSVCVCVYKIYINIL